MLGTLHRTLYSGTSSSFCFFDGGESATDCRLPMRSLSKGFLCVESMSNTRSPFVVILEREKNKIKIIFTLLYYFFSLYLDPIPFGDEFNVPRWKERRFGVFYMRFSIGDPQKDEASRRKKFSNRQFAYLRQRKRFVSSRSTNGLVFPRRINHNGIVSTGWST